MAADHGVCAKYKFGGDDQNIVKVVRTTIKMSLGNYVDKLEWTIELEGNIMQYLLCSSQIFFHRGKGKEKEGFIARRLISFWGDDQNVLEKGHQIQSVIPLDQMCKVILSVITWEIC
jgi:hypothetical protein